MSTRDRLLGAIAADPDDDGPRQVYADWLDETGDADATASARAVREQLALPAGDDDLTPWVRAHHRLVRVARDVRAALPPTASLVYRRGLPWRLHLPMTYPDLDAWLPRLAAVTPTLQRITCPAIKPLVAAITHAWPHLRDLELQRAHGEPFTLPPATRGVDGAHLGWDGDQRATRLTFGGDVDRDDDLRRALRRLPLRELRLVHEGPSAQLPPLPRTLQRLSLHGVQPGTCDDLPALSDLRGVSGHDLTDGRPSTAAIARLHRLSLTNAGHERRLGETLLGARQLRELELWVDNPLHGAQTVALALRAPALSALRLPRSTRSDGVLAALLDHGSRLRWLGLRIERASWLDALLGDPGRLPLVGLHLELATGYRTDPGHLARLRSFVHLHPTLRLVATRPAIGDLGRPDLLQIDPDRLPRIRLAWPTDTPFMPEGWQ